MEVARVPGQAPGGGQAPVGAPQKALGGGLPRAVVRVPRSGGDHRDGDVHALRGHLVQTQEHRPGPLLQARAVAGSGVVLLDHVGGPRPSGPAAQAVGAQQAQVDHGAPAGRVRLRDIHGHPDGLDAGRHLEGETGVAVLGLVDQTQVRGHAPQNCHWSSLPVGASFGMLFGAAAPGRRRVRIDDAGTGRSHGSILS